MWILANRLLVFTSTYCVLHKILIIVYVFFVAFLQDVGCQEACSFHDWHGGSQHSPVVEARGERALTIDSGTLRWPRPSDLLSPSAQRLVYVIMRRRDPGTRRSWSQLGQTPGYKARLPKTTAPWTVRVLAVSAEGLVTIFSPAPVTATSVLRVPVESVAARGAAADGSPSQELAATQPPTLSSPAATPVLHDLRDADIIIRSLGRDQILGIRLPLAAKSAPQEESLRLMVSRIRGNLSLSIHLSIRILLAFFDLLFWFGNFVADSVTRCKFAETLMVISNILFYFSHLLTIQNLHNIPYSVYSSGNKSKERERVIKLCVYMEIFTIYQKPSLYMSEKYYVVPVGTKKRK